MAKYAFLDDIQTRLQSYAGEFLQLKGKLLNAKQILESNRGGFKNYSADQVSNFLAENQALSVKQGELQAAVIDMTTVVSGLKNTFDETGELPSDIIGLTISSASLFYSVSAQMSAVKNHLSVVAGETTTFNLAFTIFMFGVGGVVLYSVFGGKK